MSAPETLEIKVRLQMQKPPHEVFETIVDPVRMSNYFMAKMLGMEYMGVFRAIFVSETAIGLFTLWLFKKGKWKNVRL